MPVFKPLLSQQIALDPKGWARKLGLSKRQIERVMQGESAIHPTTARRIQKAFNKELGKKYRLSDLFYPSEIRWLELDRKITYIYGAKPLTDEEKAGIVRYILEGRFHP